MNSANSGTPRAPCTCQRLVRPPISAAPTMLVSAHQLVQKDMTPAAARKGYTGPNASTSVNSASRSAYLASRHITSFKSREYHLTGSGGALALQGIVAAGFPATPHSRESKVHRHSVAADNDGVRRATRHACDGMARPPPQQGRVCPDVQCRPAHALHSTMHDAPRQHMPGKAYITRLGTQHALYATRDVRRTCSMTTATCTGP